MSGAATARHRWMGHGHGAWCLVLPLLSSISQLPKKNSISYSVHRTPSTFFAATNRPPAPSPPSPSPPPPARLSPLGSEIRWLKAANQLVTGSTQLNPGARRVGGAGAARGAPYTSTRPGFFSASFFALPAGAVPPAETGGGQMAFGQRLRLMWPARRTTRYGPPT
jgi:hypothetical protein